MGKTVRELETELTSREFAEWMAFWEVEPFGPIRDNLHAGHIASLLYNVNRPRNASPKSPSDFLYKDRDTQRGDSTKEFMAGLRALAKPKVH